MNPTTNFNVRHVERLLRQIRLAKRPSTKAYRVRRYLNSRDAKMKAVLKARSAMKPARRPAHEKLEAIAKNLDPWKATEEPVLVHRKPKGPVGYYRDVLEFSIENRARQFLVRDVLTELLALHPCQYLLNGGVQEAIRQTKKALKAGYCWAVEIDIHDCYPSFDGKELIKLLPLPKEVTQKVIISDCLSLVPGNLLYYYGPEDDFEGDPFTIEAALSSVRRGLPQGSAASPVVAEAMIAIALKDIPNLGVIIAYADNVLLLAKSESDVTSMTQILKDALEAHPVGRLRPWANAFMPGQPIKFLGHLLTLQSGVVRIEVTHARLDKFQERVSSELAYLNKAKLHPLTRAHRFKRLKAYVRSWTSAFKLCCGMAQLRSHWLKKVKTLQHAGHALDG